MINFRWGNADDAIRAHCTLFFTKRQAVFFQSGHTSREPRARVWPSRAAPQPEPAARELREAGDETIAIWTTRSTLWEKKEYRLTVGPDSFLYEIRVWGPKSPREIRYFSGAAEGSRPGGAYECSGYLLPQPRIGVENHCYTMAEDNAIEMQLMTPPPFCFPFFTEEGDDWFGLGLAARAGGYRFDSFRFQNQSGRFLLSTRLGAAFPAADGYPVPGILGVPGRDGFDVLARYADWHYRHGCPRNSSPRPRWWRGPFFCGWGEQAAIADRTGRSIFDIANQTDYTEMSDRLDRLDLHPTAIIIDDKWQESYGALRPDPQKWPELRAFADREHQKGRRVVLWLKCWSSEGLPADECYTLFGQPAAADPTNPRYIRRLREAVHFLLSEQEGCCACDGFKIDFADCMPRSTEADIRTHEPGVCGVELLKRLLSLIHSAAKAAKPDALINCSACHPYFAETLDQVRLHDYDYRLRSVKSCMRFRKRLYEAILPGVTIDTDFPAFAGYRDSMKYLRLAPELGVPDLYRMSDREDCAFGETDWDEVREIWARYAEAQDGLE